MYNITLQNNTSWFAGVYSGTTRIAQYKQTQWCTSKVKNSMITSQRSLNKSNTHSQIHINRFPYLMLTQTELLLRSGIRQRCLITLPFFRQIIRDFGQSNQLGENRAFLLERKRSSKTRCTCRGYDPVPGKPNRFIRQKKQCPSNCLQVL